MSERNQTLSILMERVHEQSENKKLWKDNDDPHLVAKMIVEEGGELIEAINHDEEAFAVASEIGDVLYLTLKLCAQLGIKPEDAVEMKLLRNDMKYPTDLNSYGDDYRGAREASKKMWQAMGGDIAFSHAYLELMGQEEAEPISGSIRVEQPSGTVYASDNYSI